MLPSGTEWHYDLFDELVIVATLLQLRCQVVADHRAVVGHGGGVRR
jgi:hypothetical protein